MVELEILSGQTAGNRWRARRFPFRIGRSPQCDLRFEENGVWDQHAEISLDPATGFVLRAFPDALITTNGQPVQHTVLRNGDEIELGAVRLRFWLAEARQRGLRLSEAWFWTCLLYTSPSPRD